MINPERQRALDARLAKWKLLEKLPVTAEEKTRWAEMMHRTWQAIGGDVQDAMRYCPGQKLTRALIVEAVFDANRMEMYGGLTKEEAEFVMVAYSRPSFQRWASKEMNY
jgi:hypothetical protein